ncbi:hypothetical protein P9112_002173 [Eukaryota sp. TZLM1-RC]
MSNHTASLINGSGQDINGNSPSKESNPPSTESNPSFEKSNPSFGKSNPPQESELPAQKSLASHKGSHLPNKESEPPAEKSITSQKGGHLPNKESGNHVVDVTELYTYPNNSSELVPCRKSFLTPSKQQRFKVFSITNNSNACTEGEGGEDEQQSKTSSSRKTPSSPTSDTTSSEEPQSNFRGTHNQDNSRRGDESNDEPPHTPNPSTPTPSFPSTERTSQGPYRRKLAKAVDAVTRDYLLDLIANHLDDLMNWSDDELLKMAENESERLLGDVDPAECEKVRCDYLAKRWPFLFGEFHGKTLDDVVYESYDQSPNLLKRLHDFTDSAVSCGMSAVEDCYFSAPRSKYQAAIPRPAKWHRDAIDDHKIYFSGNQEAYDRLFWIAKIHSHNQQGRNLRGVVMHFLVENVHPKDSIADICLMLGGRFDESRGDTLQFHAKKSYIREIGTRVIESKEQRVGPNKLKLVYPDAWMAKLKAGVDSWPDQNVFENVLIKSSCLPYDHKFAEVPRGSKVVPDWVDLRPPAQTVPVQEEPPKTRFIIKLGETLPSEERNMNLFSTPSVGPLASRRASCEATPSVRISKIAYNSF